MTGWQLQKDEADLKCFVNTQDEKKIIHLMALRTTKELNIHVKLPPYYYEMFEQSLYTNIEFGPYHKHGIIFDELSCQASLTVIENEERDVIFRFLAVLFQFDETLNEILPTIKKHFHFFDIKKLHAEIKEKLHSESYPAAFNLAHNFYKNGYKDTLHALAIECVNSGYMSEAEQTLNWIDVDDVQGQFRAANICMWASGITRHRGELNYA